MAERKKVKDTKGNYIPSLWVDTASGCYYVRKQKKGRLALDKSLGSVSLSLAKRLKDQAIADWLGEDAPGARRKSKLHRFDDVWENKYFPVKLSEVKKSTCTAYDVTYRTVLKPAFHDLYVELFNEEHWEKLLSELPKETILFNAHKGMNNFLKYCQDTLKIIDRRPRLRLPQERKQRLVGAKKAAGKVYARQDVVMAARAAGRGSELRLAILMGYRMGMRIGEICSLRYIQGERPGEHNFIEFRSDGAVVHLNETKTKRDRHIYAEPMVARILKKRKNNNSAWVFPQRKSKTKNLSTNGLDNYWQVLKRDIGLDGRFHDLRHTFLTWKFREHGAKTNIALICSYAGLSLHEAEKTYLHLNEYDTRSIVEVIRA